MQELLEVYKVHAKISEVDQLSENNKLIQKWIFKWCESKTVWGGVRIIFRKWNFATIVIFRKLIKLTFWIV